MGSASTAAPAMFMTMRAMPSAFMALKLHRIAVRLQTEISIPFARITGLGHLVPID